jgi:hypothetical protein
MFKTKENRMKFTNHLLCALTVVLAVSAADANTLKDKPPTIFYPAGHYLEGEPRTTRFDIFGYNYQAHRFHGSFANIYLGGDGFPPYDGDTAEYYQMLVDEGFATDLADAASQMNALWYWSGREVDFDMTWNDAWLSNKDLVDVNDNEGSDGELDRHRGYPTYHGSGAWLTNKRSGIDYVEHQGELKETRWSYYIKMVAVPSDAYLQDGIWYTAAGEEIGEERFGNLAAVQIISNDKVYAEHGLLYRSPAGPGYGIYGPE